MFCSGIEKARLCYLNGMGSAFPVADELGTGLDCRRPARLMVRICGECHFKFPQSALGSIGQATLYLRL
jgi:hypothetical protein